MRSWNTFSIIGLFFMTISSAHAAENLAFAIKIPNENSKNATEGCADLTGEWSGSCTTITSKNQQSTRETSESVLVLGVKDCTIVAKRGMPPFKIGVKKTMIDESPDETQIVSMTFTWSEDRLKLLNESRMDSKTLSNSGEVLFSTVSVTKSEISRQDAKLLTESEASVTMTAGELKQEQTVSQKCSYDKK